MRATLRADHNFVFRGPRPEIGDLSVELREERSVVRSHWRPSEEELAILNAGGSIELDVYSVPPPPVAVNAVEALEGEEVHPFKLPRVDGYPV